MPNEFGEIVVRILNLGKERNFGGNCNEVVNILLYFFLE